jgi:PDGLE domain
MKSKSLIFFGIILPIVLGAFISPLASSSPDAFERICEKSDIEAAESSFVSERAIASDYQFHMIENSYMSTGTAGLFGTLLVFFVAIFLMKLIKKNLNEKPKLDDQQ